MKIAIIAANSRSGVKVVRAALAAGHKVVAGVRGSHKFAPNKHLTIQDCDATNYIEVEALVHGCDAVISLIGHVNGTHPEAQTLATKHCITSMNKLGIKRLISLTGTGVRFDGDCPLMIDRFMNFGISLIDPLRISDGRQHAQLLRDSDLDWTIVRVLKLQNISAKPYQLTTGGPAKLITSRSEVASAIMTVLDDKSFIRQAPIISRP